ncbi:MAG: hypothetical protein N2588_01655 [Rhodovarius sp.]|nr:hypothetical protein [Rhodovarius sp.]
MKRWVPFAVALFMLTPFALWMGFAATGMGGGWSQLGSPAGSVILAASVPLAGLFWIQNLRQLGDAIGAPSRLALAEGLARALPFAILLIGAGGSLWLLHEGEGPAMAAVAVVATLVMAGFGWLAARAPVEPCPARPEPPLAAAEEQEIVQGVLLCLANIGMVLALVAYYWTPMVLLWAVYAAVPVAFLAIMALAWWAAQPARATAPAPRRQLGPAPEVGAAAGRAHRAA